MAKAETIPNTARWLSIGRGGRRRSTADRSNFRDHRVLPIGLRKVGVASLACDEVAAEIRGKPVTDADRDWIEAVADELREAVDLLACTVPTTRAGLAAAVEWIMEYERGSIPRTSVRFLQTLAGVVR